MRQAQGVCCFSCSDRCMRFAVTKRGKVTQDVLACWVCWHACRTCQDPQFHPSSLMSGHQHCYECCTGHARWLCLHIVAPIRTQQDQSLDALCPHHCLCCAAQLVPRHVHLRCCPQASCSSGVLAPTTALRHGPSGTSRRMTTCRKRLRGWQGPRARQRAGKASRTGSSRTTRPRSGLIRWGGLVHVAAGAK